MKQRFIFHPIIFALYPILSLYLINYGMVQFNQTLLSFSISFVALILIWLLVKAFLPNSEKAAFCVSVFFLLFFFYGHFVTALEYSLFLFDTNLGAQFKLHSIAVMATILIIWILLFITILALTQKSKWNFKVLTDFMNIVSISLLCFSIVKGVQSILDRQEKLSIVNQATNIGLFSEEITLSQTLPNNSPNIYYIVLDGYGRSDILENIYDYDNSDFIDFLRQKKFYVADQAHSNYNFTYVALTSTLNLDYLVNLSNYFGEMDANTFPVRFMFENNLFVHLLRENGYTIISVPSSADFLPQFVSDIQVAPVSLLGSFDMQVLNATPMRFILRGYLHDQHRDWVKYQFNSIPQIASASSPQFVFAHIINPHPPFVFTAEGEPTNPVWEFSFIDGTLTNWFGRELYIKGYSEQVAYTTTRARILVEQLLEADPGAVIILQSDHGPGSQHDQADLAGTNVDERFSTLSAFYFPNGEYSSLYPSITPVNSFRVVANQYLGTDIELIEDKSYWINILYPYNQIDVTERLSNSSGEK